jgi:prolipoprotein diacylglyceryl transferase
VRPVFAHVGRYAVPSHELFVFLGTVVAAAVFFHETRRRDLADERLLWIIAGTLLGGAIGAKLATIWRYVAFTGDHSLEGMLLRGGRSILGGLAGAYVGAVITKRAVRYPRRTGDLFAPAVALGMAVGRVGCFLSEQVGTPTTLPWGLRLGDATLAQIPNCPYCAPGVALHPSFIYEILFHLAMFALLISYLRPRVTVEGDLFKIYLLAYAVFRFLVEVVRGNLVIWHGLTGSQLFLIPSTALLIAYFVRQRVKKGVGSGPHLARDTSV